MVPYKPVVHLIKEVHLDNPTIYYLHAVTMCDKSCYVADGYAPLSNELNEDGAYPVVLKIIRDVDLPELNLITPVTHVIRLGELPFGNEEGLIQVKVIMIKAKGNENEKTAGNVTVSSASASKPIKPIWDV